MMSREICKECCNRDGKSPWDEADERSWDREGVVYCCMSKIDRGDRDCAVKIAEPPPRGCYFCLEHMVLEQKTEKL